MLLYFFACIPQVPIEKTTSDSATESSEFSAYALITTASYSDGLGALATLNVETHQVVDNLTQNIHSDALSRIVDDQVYQINRLGMDAIRIYNWGEWDTPQNEWHLGESSNPQDVAQCANRLFISLYRSNYIPIYDLDGTLLHSMGDG